MSYIALRVKRENNKMTTQKDTINNFLKHVIDTTNIAMSHADQIGLSKRMDKKMLSEFVVQLVNQCISIQMQPLIKAVNLEDVKS